MDGSRRSRGAAGPKRLLASAMALATLLPLLALVTFADRDRASGRTRGFNASCPSPDPTAPETTAPPGKRHASRGEHRPRSGRRAHQPGGGNADDFGHRGSGPVSHRQTRVKVQWTTPGNT